MSGIFYKSVLNNAPRIFKILRGQNLYFPLNYSCHKRTLGNRNASFTICPEAITDGDTVYSVGIGTDISFDMQLIENFKVSVYAFDPTPKSIDWLSQQKTPENFKAFPIGLASYTGEAEFFLPVNENFVSASMTNKQSNRKVTVKVKTLTDLMSELGHTSISILKMDIEGAEYEVIDNILESRIRIHQLLIEFHHRFHVDGIKKTRDSIQKLNASGFELFHVSGSGEEFSFINLKYHE